MSNFKQKLIYMIVLFLCALVTLAPTRAASNPFEDLFDNRFNGFFSGAGIGYGITQLEGTLGGSSARSTAGQTQWKLGYAISEQTGFYVTSIFTDLELQFGVMYFYEPKQRYYITALAGYSSHSSEVHDWGIGSDTLTLAGGLGYEFRRHFLVEGTGGYQQQKFSTSTSLFPSASSSIDRNQYTFVATVNYLFY